MFALCIESSHARGMGHLYRALHLANALCARGHDVQFFINDDTTALEILSQHGHSARAVHLSDLTSNWEAQVVSLYGVKVWVNDRLDTNAAHSMHVASLGIPLVTFDDPGSGAKLASLHIAALAFDKLSTLLGKRVLQGVDYLILNPEIAKYQSVRTRAMPILVTLGGSDTYGVTGKVVRALAEQGLSATVILGPSFQHEMALAQVLTDTFVVKRGVSSMVLEMASHGLAITGGGITPFEANAAGLPCIVIANEVFEVPAGQALQRLGGSVFVGHHSQLDDDWLNTDLPIETMSRAGMTNIGLRGLGNVVQALEELLAI